jgi:DNA-binding CsgD family transcriptional regulator
MYMLRVDGKHMRALDRLAAAQTAPEVISLALEEAPAISVASAVGVYLFAGGCLDVISRGAPDRAVSKYLSLPVGSDPLLTHMQAMRLPVHERSLFSPKQWRVHPLYECVAGPFGFEHYLMAPLVGRGGGIIGALTLARDRHMPAFTQLDLTAIAMTSAFVSVALTCNQQYETSLRASLSRLTPREQMIARLVAKGLTNDEIAEPLEISVNTVKKHLKSIFFKLEVTRRAELAWLVTLGGMV